MPPTLFAPRAFLAFFAVASFAIARHDNRQFLLEHSPFAAPSTVETSPIPDSDLELRGVVREGERTLVSIFDASAKVSRWLVVGDRTEGIEVISYDAVTESVHVQLAGRTLSLPLKNGRTAKAQKFTVMVL